MAVEPLFGGRIEFQEAEVSAVAQWVKNPTAVTWVTAEVQVGPLAQSNEWVKDLVLPHLWCSLAQVKAMAWIKSLTYEISYAAMWQLKKKKNFKKQIWDKREEALPLGERT